MHSDNSNNSNARSATASLMRSVNRSAILDLVRRNGPITRTQIANRLNMSIQTVVRIVDELEEEDLVKYHGKKERTGGRRSPLLEFNGSGYSVLGVDLSGSRMCGLLTDLAGHTQHEIYKPSRYDQPETNLENLIQLIAELLEAAQSLEVRLRGIGIGVPAVTISEEGVVTWSPGLGWENLPLKAILTERFNLPTLVENESNLAALGELGFGAGQKIQSLISIVIGNKGVGSGIIVDGALHRGFNYSAGEIGYLIPGVNFLGPRPAQSASIGSRICEMGIVKRATEVLQQKQLPIDTSELTAQIVLEKARLGEAWAHEVADEVADYLSILIVSATALLAPEAIILGGNLANSLDFLIEPIYRRLAGIVQYKPYIAVSPLGNRAIVMGAIMLVLSATTEHFTVNRVP